MWGRIYKSYENSVHLEPWLLCYTATSCKTMPRPDFSVSTFLALIKCFVTVQWHSAGVWGSQGYRWHRGIKIPTVFCTYCFIMVQVFLVYSIYCFHFKFALILLIKYLVYGYGFVLSNTVRRIRRTHTKTTNIRWARLQSSMTLQRISSDRWMDSWMEGWMDGWMDG